MASPIGNFILWLHQRALAEGRLPETSEEACDLLLAIRDGAYADAAHPVELETVGLELRDGRPNSELARTIQRRALRETRNLTLVLSNVDEVGYTTVNVRALLGQHFWDAKRAAVGSDAWCAYLDLVTAIDRASERTKIVAWLLIAGYGPQETGELLGSNGSRRINRAVGELAKILGGRHYAKVTNY